MARHRNGSCRWKAKNQSFRRRKGGRQHCRNLKAKFLLEMETLNYELDNSTDQVRFDITKKDGSKLETLSYRGRAGFPAGASGSTPRGCIGG